MCTSTPGCSHPRCPPWIIALDQGLATIAAVDWRELPCHYGVSCTGKDKWCPHNHSISAQFLVRLSSAETQDEAQRIADKLNNTWAQRLTSRQKGSLRRSDTEPSEESETDSIDWSEDGEAGKDDAAWPDEEVEEEYFTFEKFLMASKASTRSADPGTT